MALYNSDYISKLEAKRTKLVATFNDGTTATIGEFKSIEDCQAILKSATQNLLFEYEDHPGFIIRDTKEKKT